MSQRVFPVVLFGLVACVAEARAAEELDNAWQVGDDILTLRLTRSAQGEILETCRVHGVDMPYEGVPGAWQVDGQEWQELRTAAVSESDGGVDVRGETAGITWTVRYERTGRGLVTKSLVLLRPEPLPATGRPTGARIPGRNGWHITNRFLGLQQAPGGCASAACGSRGLRDEPSARYRIHAPAGYRGFCS